MIKKKLLNFSKKVIFCPSAGRQECPGPPNSWPILNFKVKTCIKEDLVHTCSKSNHSDERYGVGGAGWLGGGAKCPPRYPWRVNNVTGDSDNNYDYITEAESHTPNDENVTPSFSNREKERLDYKKFHSSGEKVIKVMHS